MKFQQFLSKFYFFQYLIIWTVYEVLNTEIFDDILNVGMLGLQMLS